MMPSSRRPRTSPSALSTGWSRTITGTSLAVRSPTWSVSISASPRTENRSDRGASAAITPDFSPARLLSRVIGAPRSKIRWNGPLPLILARTTMWFVRSISNGTVAFPAGPGGSSAAAARPTEAEQDREQAEQSQDRA